jgi:Zn-dependent protease
MMGLLNQGFKVGRLFDITIRVHFIFVLWIAFELVRAGAGWQERLWFLGMLFGIVLLHELGHCFGARSVGGDARNILMWPLGGLAYAHAPMRPWEQFVTIAAGPAVNMVFCVLSALAILLMSGCSILPGINPLGYGVFNLGTPLYEPVLSPAFFYVFIFYRVNLFLLAFNLLPIFPFDGGQIFRVILWTQMGLQRATVLACQVGIGGAIVLGFIGIQTGGILLFIAIFGAFSCWQMLQAAKYGMLIEDTAFQPQYYGPRGDPRPWYQKLFRIKPRRRKTVSENPNPGAWQARQREEENEEAELDRLLQKVSEQGIGSLSYVERQKLERITRERQKREREFERNSTL